jgi:hypothetical protein
VKNNLITDEYIEKIIILIKFFIKFLSGFYGRIKYKVTNCGKLKISRFKVLCCMYLILFTLIEKKTVKFL